MLHEVRGHRAVANEMYFRALGNVLRGEALSRPSRRATNPGSPGVVFRGRPDLGVSRDYQTYFGFLEEGFLGTWPQDGDEGTERINDVEAMFEEAVQAVLATGDLERKTVDEFPRLDRTARFVRRVAKNVGDRELQARVDSVLEEHFRGDDEELETSTPAPSLLARHLERAKRSGNFAHAVQLARLVGDDETLVDLLRDRIADGNYQDGLVNAWLLLDETAFKRLVTPIASTLKDDAQAFLTFVGQTSHLVPAMEETLGREFISVSDLIELTSQPDGSDAGVSLAAFGLLRGIWRYVQAKGSLEEQVGFVASIVQREEQGLVTWYAATPLVADLLSVELSSEQRITLTDALAVLLSKQELSTPHHLANLLRMLLVDVHSANVALVYTLAGQLQERATTDIDLVAVLKDIYEGTPELAFAGLLELSNAQLWRSGIRDARSIHHRFTDEAARIVAAVERGEAVATDTARLAYDLSFSYFGETPRERLKRQADLAPKFAALDPGNSRYRLAHINTLLNLGEWSGAEDALRGYYGDRPKDEFARAALYFRLVGEGKYRSALEVVTDGGGNLRDQTVVEALLERMRRGGGVSSGLLGRFYSGPMPSSPYGRYTPAMERNIDRLREAASAHADSTAAPDTRSVDENAASKEATLESTVESLRAVWRGTRAPVDDGSRRYYMPNPAVLLALPLDVDGPGNPPSYVGSVQVGSISGLARSRPGRSDAQRLFDVVAEMPGVAEELERFIPALPGHERRNQPRLYELLADALGAAGLSDARLDELTSRLREGNIRDHDFTLWMTLRHRADEALSADELDAFAKRAAAFDDPTQSELLLMARLFAKGGAFADSAEHYSLLAANLVRRGGSGGNRRTVMLQGAGAMMVSYSVSGVFSFGSGNVSGPGLSEILAETAEILPPETAMALARDVLAVARPSEDDEALAAIFDAFVLKILGLVASPGDVLPKVVEISPTATVVEAPLEMWAVPKVLELARVHAIAGNHLDALRLLRHFVVSNERNGDTSIDLFDEERSRRAAAASTLASTFGLPLLSLRYGPQTPLSGLVNGRERIFPAGSDHAWLGAADWMRAATEAIPQWLDDEDVDPVGVREMLFVVAGQLHAAGEHESARDVVAVLGTGLDKEADVDAVELRDLALLALRIGSPLPADLAVAVAAGGALTARQEADLVRELADDDPLGALRTGRAADRGDKLPLMRELHAVALAAEDTAYAADLATRIELSEAAYRELGSPPVLGDGANP